MQPKSCGCPHHTEALEREMCRAVLRCRPFADVSLLCSSSPTSALYAQRLHSQAIRSRVIRQNALTLVQASLEAHNELLERFLAREQQQLPAQLPTSPPAGSAVIPVGGRWGRSGGHGLSPSWCSEATTICHPTMARHTQCRNHPLRHVVVIGTRECWRQCQAV